MLQKDLITTMEFFKHLVQLPYVKRVILYGSRARGDNKERSDIDIAIDCPYASINDWLSILEVIDNADTLLKIDCVRYDTLADSNPLKQAIDKDGVELFTRK